LTHFGLVTILWATWCKAFPYFTSYVVLIKHIHSFGIGFNMMQTGHDAAGVWETLENGMK
jgi:hypothetical protein